MKFTDCSVDRTRWCLSSTVASLIRKMLQQNYTHTVDVSSDPIWLQTDHSFLRSLLFALQFVESWWACLCPFIILYFLWEIILHHTFLFILFPEYKSYSCSASYLQIANAILINIPCLILIINILSSKIMFKVLEVFF